MCSSDLGMAASMGAFLLSSGTKGRRLALPNSEIMIHQPSGGAQGQATDIAIQAERVLKMKKNLTQILADNCRKSMRLWPLTASGIILCPLRKRWSTA